MKLHWFVVHCRLWSHIDDQFVYLLTDYVPGGELFHYLRVNGQLEEPHARLYASEVVLVLEYLHDRSVMHRDIKPENILVDLDGHIKVTDFEFARILPDRCWNIKSNQSFVMNWLWKAKDNRELIEYTTLLSAFFANRKCCKQCNKFWVTKLLWGCFINLFDEVNSLVSYECFILFQ